MKRLNVKWDEKMQVIIDGQVVPHSNLVDLVNFYVTSMAARKLNTMGMAKVNALLVKNNAPLSLFGKEGKRVLKAGGNDVVDGWKTFEKFLK